MDIILTCAQMRAADKYTIEELGVPSLTLMERAGEAIADRAERALRLRGGTRVLAVCGGGNNGGDGFVAARLLAERGYTAEAYVLPGKNSPDCAAVRARFKGKVHAALPHEKYDVVIDALFGTGFHGEPQGEAAAAIGWIEQSGAFVISADIPSGLDGDTGEAGQCVRACETVTIGEYKAGLLLGAGCADPYAPKPLRAAMGSIYHLPVWQGELEGEIPRLVQQGFTCICGHLKGGDTLPKVGERCVLVIGNEGSGVSDPVAAQCHKYRLPMYGFAESLNASVAAGILIYELAKQMHQG